MIREDDMLHNITIKYKYDEYGNILSVNKYRLNSNELLEIHKYNYDGLWTDQLSKYDNKMIIYDNIGNPINYGDIVYTWENGHSLASYCDNVNSIQYKYNDKGIRIRKIVNGTETKYYSEGSNIIFEEKGNTILYFIRDNNGELVGLKYGDDIFYYIKNLQNDIIGIIDSVGNTIVRYTYDSWGNIISICDSNGNVITNEGHIGIINPFRYRSYYYDNETDLYYLNNRYYSPKWKRFINCDPKLINDPSSLSLNLYAYADNNPINKVDVDGNKSWLLKTLFKAAKKVVKKIVKVVSIVAPVVKAVIKVVKKPSIIIDQLKKQAKADSKFIKDHFYFEAGVGKGFSGTLGKKTLKLSAGAFQDYTRTFSKNQWVTSVVGSSGVGYNSKVTFSGDYSCEYNPANTSNNSFFDKMNYTCENPNKSHTLASENLGYSNDTIFIGFEGEAHLFLGGHFKIGFQFDKSEFGL